MSVINCWMILIENAQLLFLSLLVYFFKGKLKNHFLKYPAPLPHPFSFKCPHWIPGLFFPLLCCLLYFGFHGWHIHPLYQKRFLLSEKKAEQCCHFKRAQVTLNGSLMWAGSFALGSTLGKPRFCIPVGPGALPSLLSLILPLGKQT